MTGDRLADRDHVVRYVIPSKVQEGGRVDGTAFQRRVGEDAVSVNWLEAFPAGKDEQIEAVRQVFRLRRARNGRFAELQVGEVRRYLLAEAIEMTAVQRPLSAEGDFPADPSHAELTGLPPRDSEDAEVIGDMIADCVLGLHPAVSEPGPGAESAGGRKLGRTRAGP